jgi:hypothetical protein
MVQTKRALFIDRDILFCRVEVRAPAGLQAAEKRHLHFVLFVEDRWIEKSRYENVEGSQNIISWQWHFILAITHGSHGTISLSLRLRKSMEVIDEDVPVANNFVWFSFSGWHGCSEAGGKQCSEHSDCS